MPARPFSHAGRSVSLCLTSRPPNFEFSGEMAARLAGHNVHLTLSHDAGIASAMVIVEVK